MGINLLSDAKIRTAKPKEKRYGLNDGGGLWLLVHPSGTKSWHYLYSEKSKHKRFFIGEYPTFSLSDARERLLDRKRVLADIRLYGKEDFEEAATIWYESWVKSEEPTKKTEHLVRTRLNNHGFPSLGKKKLSEITTQSIIDLLLFIRGQGLHSIARTVLMDIKRIYRYAIKRNAVATSPAESIKALETLGKYKKGHHPAITEPHEFKKLICEIDGITDPLERLALQLVMLFASRTKELLASKWEQFDFENALWRLPASAMKGDDDHIVPLSFQAIELLKSLKKEVDAGEWLFFRNGTFDKNLLTRPLYRLGYKGKMCGHGFRSTFNTLLREVMKEDQHVIQKQLAHKEVNAVTAAYDRAKYLEDRKIMMQNWADYIDNMRKAA